MHARRENLKVCQHIACKHHHQSCGKRPQWWKERACGGNCIWKRHCTSNLYLRVRASIIRQELPNCWVDTLKAMLWLRDMLHLYYQAMLWERHFASLLSRLCSERDTLALYSQGYALSETSCFSTLKVMLWVRHIASLLSRLCYEWETSFLYSQGYALSETWCLPLSRLCSEGDTLPLYSQEYALSETRCLSTLKAMLWGRHTASLLSRLCSEWDMLPLNCQGYVLSETRCLSTLKAMLSEKYCLSETCCLSTLKAMFWVRHVASLLSRLCSEWDMLPLYSQGYALSETCCLSTLKAMSWVRHAGEYKCVALF